MPWNINMAANAAPRVLFHKSRGTIAKSLIGNCFFSLSHHRRHGPRVGGGSATDEGEAIQRLGIRQTRRIRLRHATITDRFIGFNGLFQPENLRHLNFQRSGSVAARCYRPIRHRGSGQHQGPVMGSRREGKPHPRSPHLLFETSRRSL
jgi:hypothetical protein